MTEQLNNHYSTDPSRLQISVCYLSFSQDYHLLEDRALVTHLRVPSAERHPTPVLLPGKSHGQGSLVGCSPWGCEESDTTGATSLSRFTFMHWTRKWQRTPVFLLENPRDGEPGGLLSVGLHRVGHTEVTAVAAWT